MDDILKRFGRRLKELRKQRKLTQRDMAELMGMTDRNYQRFEYGQINVPAKTLVFFADFFGVTTDDLLGREESGSKEDSHGLDTAD